MKAVVFSLRGTLFDSSEGRLRKGTKELLPILHRLGIKVVAFSPNDVRAAERLHSAGVDRYFDAIVADRDDNRSSSAGLSMALRAVAVQPQEAVVVGRSISDMWLGKDIHSPKVVGIAQTADTAQTLRSAGADYVVSDIASVLDVIE